MLRYRLDDLGAYQFEKPTQSSLKALVGLGVESGGNRGDWGRDSSHQVPSASSNLSPDTRTQVQTDSPFIFPAKFVEGASAGAKPYPAWWCGRRRPARMRSISVQWQITVPL